MKNILLYFIVLFSCNVLLGHPMPNSIINIGLYQNYISGTAQMPLQELKNAWKTTDDVSINDTNAIAYFINHINAISLGKAWQTTIDSVSMTSAENEDVGFYQEVVVHFRLIPYKGANLKYFDFYYDVIIHQVVNHSAMVYLTEDWSNGIHHTSSPIPLGTIEIDVATNKLQPLKVVLPKGSAWLGFKNFVNLGMHHIASGIDHLFFLLTLLLPACLVVEKKQWSKYGGWKYSIVNILKIVTAFTIGHSITLLLCTLMPSTISTYYVEIAIGISILASAIHAYVPIFYKKENYIAIGFGMIHGMAFSDTLAKLHLGTKQLLLSLLGFNIGIELMQAFIVTLFLPLLLAASRHRHYSWIRKIAACIAIVASLAWIEERITGIENDISAILNDIPLFVMEVGIFVGAMSVFAIIYFINIKPDAKNI